MKKIISYIFIVGIFLNAPSYALKSHSEPIRKSGKYGFSIISNNSTISNNKFNKNNWIRSREKKVKCGQPNVVGIQSTSSALIIASVPQPIPDYTKCSPIKLV